MVRQCVSFNYFSVFKADLSCWNSAEMLLNLGVTWVILGHSERRLIMNESNEVTFVAESLVYHLSFLYVWVAVSRISFSFFFLVIYCDVPYSSYNLFFRDLNAVRWR